MNDKKQLGQLIRELRKIARLSKQQLADGICSAEELEKYESGEEFITSHILYKLSKRLGVSMNYFFEVGEVTSNDYSNEIKATIRHYIRKRDYETVLHIVNKEKENPMFQDPFHAQFFLWHEAICDYYINNSFDQALEKLEKAISFTRISEHFYSEKEIAILNSIAIIYDEEGQLKKAFSTYMEALQHITLLPKLKDPLVKIRILYGLSKALCQMKRFEKSVKYGKLGLALCIQHETLYLLGELHFQVGESLYHTGQYEEGMRYLQKSIHIFEIEENDAFVALVKQEIDQLKMS
ncbi:helix-turn-helix transcriptional regulator [Priestia megaterium]|nr:helix-turn-helix transcriptional regulator [Priestia megaterium]